MITKDQAAKRLESIGGSSIAAALGLSKYKTPLRLWMELTGNVPPEDISDKMQVRVGTKAEALVCELFTEDTGKKVQRVNEPFVHEQYPFLVGHIDRKVVGEKSIIEAKTISAWREREYDDGAIPTDYFIQTLFYVGLTGSERGYLCTLIGNHRFHVQTIEFDAQLYGEIVKKAAAFWNDFVVPKIMPVITKDDADNLYSLFPLGDEEKTVMLDDKAQAIIESLEGMKADYKSLEGQIERQENEIKAMLGDATAGLTNTHKVQWSNQSRTTIDSKLLKATEPDLAMRFSKTTQTRVFKVSKLKEKK